jgi:hypothetical protein
LEVVSLRHRGGRLQLQCPADRRHRVSEDEAALGQGDDEGAFGDEVAGTACDLDALDGDARPVRLGDGALEEVRCRLLVAHVDADEVRRRGRGGDRVEREQGFGDPDGERSASADPREDVLGDSQTDLVLGQVVELAKHRLEVGHLVDQPVALHGLGEGAQEAVDAVDVAHLEGSPW